MAYTIVESSQTCWLQEGGGEYKWSDGWPNVFVNWGADEPGNQGDCVTMDSNGEWEDSTCGTVHYSVCKLTEGKSTSHGDSPCIRDYFHNTMQLMQPKYVPRLCIVFLLFYRVSLEDGIISRALAMDVSNSNFITQLARWLYKRLQSIQGEYVSPSSNSSYYTS